MDESIEITLEEYEQLVDRDLFLQALEECGVDDWDDYNLAIEVYHGMKEE